MAVTITDVPLVTNCNEFALTIFGTNQLVTDLEALFDSATAFDLAVYTDGY
jgi:hypothetical protein